eukprot:451620-Pyramimonas_sp.AAC.1
MRPWPCRILQGRGALAPPVCTDPRLEAPENSRKGYLTGWVPVRAARWCVVPAAHMSYSVPDSDP